MASLTVFIIRVAFVVFTWYYKRTVPRKEGKKIVTDWRQNFEFISGLALLIWTKPILQVSIDIPNFTPFFFLILVVFG